MNARTPIAPGCRVVMRYTLSLPEGTVVETTGEDAPIEFEMGDGTLIQGLENALYGLRAGDRQSLLIEPREGFGFPDPANHHVLPRAEFDAYGELRAGMVIGFTLPSGEEIPGTLMEIGDQEVRVDFNHPLAGHDVLFEVEILDVQAPAMH